MISRSSLKMKLHTPTRSAVKVFAKAENQAVGLQYARALVEAASSSGDLDAIHSDIDTLGLLIKETDNLCSVMTNPLVPAENKFSLIKQISSEGSFNKLTTNFLNVLVDKERINCIVEIVESFDELYCEENDTQITIVKSAVALEEEQLFEIAKKIKELTRSKTVEIRPVIDEGVIGGFIVEYGSNQIDLS